MIDLAIKIIAAVFIVLAVVSVKLFEKDDGAEKAAYASMIPDSIWESVDIADDDADLMILRTEIEQIERDLVAIQLGENDGNGDRELAELEMKLIEINSDFWKG